MYVGADGFATLALACVVAIASFGLTLLWVTGRVVRAARRASPDAPDGDVVVVLGGGLEGDGPSRDFQDRLDRAADQRRGRDIVILGGATRPGRPAEADVGRDWLVARGIDGGRIVSETGSRDTLENLRALRGLIPVERGSVVLVTSRYHVERASTMAVGLGIRHMMCAADQTFDAAPGRLWRLFNEGCLLHWYLVGKTWARLTRNAAMLDRIS